jgi:CheY-like chemotaxis protein
MDQSITAQLIGVIPTFLWVVLIIVAILLFRDKIQARLLPRITGLKAFGIEATFVKEQLERAAEAAPAGSASDRDQVSRRAERLAALVEDSHLLLVNDIPAEMFYVIQILEGLHINVDVAMSTKEALDALTRRPYDVVISDMRRGDVTDAGIRFINESRSRGVYRPTILSVGLFDPSLGTPAYAYGITNRVDELLNLVFDVLERVRG